MTLTEATQDYLKSIYALRENSDGSPVTTQRLAQALNVAPPSATAMVKKLAELKLVSHEPYHGVDLTPEGERAALEIIRHHRLTETFLAQTLGVPWDKVHEEAERWEHVLSEDIEARIDEILNHPTHDPHGSPIPSAAGIVVREKCVALSELEVGQEREVRRVEDEDAALLRHLSKVGLRPGARVLVARREAAEGVLQLKVDGKKRLLGEQPARAVWMALQ